jgi:hypothetical protein
MADHAPDVYLAELFTGLFTSLLPLDQAARLWDVYVFEGDSLLVRAAVALLMDREMPLLGAENINAVRDVLLGKQEGEKVLARQGEEERWMRLVREAGKV